MMRLSEMPMRALNARAMLAGASMLALTLALSLAPVAAEEPTPTPVVEEQAAATFAVPLPAAPASVALVDETLRQQEAADGTVAVPLPDEPTDVVLVDEAVRRDEAAAAALAVPLPPEPEATLIVEHRDPVPAGPALAAPSLSVPMPDAPATVLVEQAVSPVTTALRAASEPAGLSGAGMPALSHKDKQAIAALYDARQDAPVWLGADGRPTAAAMRVIQQLGSAEADALDPNAYPVAALGASPSPAELARFDTTLTASAYAYARDARGGRLDPSRLSNLITPELFLPTPGEVVAGLLAAPDAATALAAWQPQHAGYKALKAKLAEMRETTAAVQQPDPIPEGPVIRPGMSDPRVPAIRKRLGLPAIEGTFYDDLLADAVADFQRERGLRATGRFDRATLVAMDGGRAAGPVSVADVMANMERWRWLPPALGERHIIVNLPEFTLRLVENGAVVHRTRVIVGKPETQTPVFSHAMEHVIVNPYWNIPPSILRKEILPKLAQDPDYAAKHGYEVIRRGNSISVRQPPGERNALGFIKFMFPNQHSVYLHDTPSRSLFANARRAYSHGCVRVEQPFRLAEFVLGDQGYSEERMRGMIGKGERMIKLRQPLPVHLTYFTVFVDDAGKLQRIEDLYGHDGRVKTALGIGADGRHFATLRGSTPR